MSVYESARIISAILKAKKQPYEENPIYNDGKLIAVTYTVPSPLLQDELLAIAPFVHYVSADISGKLRFSV